MACIKCDNTENLVDGLCPRCRAKDQVQGAQNEIGRARDAFPIGSIERTALTAAYEMTRAAWYAMDGNPKEKLAPVRDAFNDYLSAVNRRQKAVVL